MVDVYNKDKSSHHLGVALCPKLTKDNIYLTPFSKMRVNLAAQVQLFDYLCMYDSSIRYILLIQLLSVIILHIHIGHEFNCS